MVEKGPKIESPQKPAKEPEIESWESEGGSVGIEQEAFIEIPETVVEKKQVEASWQEILIQAKNEFPEDIKNIVNKITNEEKISPEEQGRLDSFGYRWFREVLGIAGKKQYTGKGTKKEPPKPLTKEELAEKQKQSEEIKRLREERKQQTAEKRSLRLAKLASNKIAKMEQLHTAIKNLDEGKPAEEFRDETRRIVYFDENEQQYFVEENDARKNLSIGDIMSDYAWGIKYVPDGEMIEPTYRTLAKKILTNETRRDIETIYNRELITAGLGSGGGSSLFPLQKMMSKVKTTEKERIKTDILFPSSGIIAEISLRELLSRVALSQNLDFIVSRATAEEDAKYKYDFKIRVKRHVRGVAIKTKNIKSIGFQLKTDVKWKSVYAGKYSKGKKVLVDEVLKLHVPGKEFVDTTKKWLEKGQPSGGPEQFLSRDLKIEILKAVTSGLTEISDEEIAQIFPS